MNYSEQLLEFLAKSFLRTVNLQVCRDDIRVGVITNLEKFEDLEAKWRRVDWFAFYFELTGKSIDEFFASVKQSIDDHYKSLRERALQQEQERLAWAEKLSRVQWDTFDAKKINRIVAIVNEK